MTARDIRSCFPGLDDAEAQAQSLALRAWARSGYTADLKVLFAMYRPLVAETARGPALDPFDPDPSAGPLACCRGVRNVLIVVGVAAAIYLWLIN